MRWEVLMLPILNIRNSRPFLWLITAFLVVGEERVISSSLYHTVTENRVETSPNKKPGVSVCRAPGSNYPYLWSQYLSVAETSDVNMMCRM